MMRKFILLYLCIHMSMICSGQTDNISFWVLPGNGAPSGLTRCPGNTYRYQRTEYLITSSEMNASGFPPGSVINAIGWDITSAGIATQTGILKIWLKNTSDLTYSLGSGWNISGFTLVHQDSSFTVPIAAGAYQIDFTGGASFYFSGGGLYVAWEFSNPSGTIGTTALQASCNNTMPNGLYGARSNSTLPGTLTPSSYRPATMLGNNDYTDRIVVRNIYTIEKVPLPFCTPADVKVRVSNISNTTASTEIELSIRDTSNTHTRHSAIQPVAGLQPLQDTVITFTWYPEILEDILIIVSASAAEGENFLVNNSLEIKANVNNSICSYSYYPTDTGRIGVNYPGSGMFAAKFHLNGSGSVTGANLFISSDQANTGNVVYAAILNQTGTIFSQSANYLIQSSDIGTMRHFAFPAPVTVSNQDFYIALVQTPGAWQYNPMGTFNESPPRSGTWYTFGINGGTPVPFTGQAVKFGIEAIFEPVILVAELMDFSAVPAGAEQINLTWSKNFYQDPVLILFNTTDILGTPQNGVSYLPGDTLPDGGIVLYTGNGNSFIHTGLAPSTVLYYKAFSVNSENQYSAGVIKSSATFYELPFFEGFDEGATLPPAWSGSMNVLPDHGISATNGLTGNLYDAVPLAEGITPYMIMGTLPVRLTFDYRVVNWAGYPWNPTTLVPGDKIELKAYYSDGAISPSIMTVDYLNHVPSNVFTEKTVTVSLPPVPVKFGVASTWAVNSSQDYYVDIDNFKVETDSLSTISEQTLISGNISETKCHSAYASIFTGGAPGPFTVVSGGNVTLIAGSNIRFMQGTSILPGAYLHALIAPGGPWCNQQDIKENQNSSENSTIHPGEELFRLFPNPAKNIFTIEAREPGTGSVLVEIFDLMGRKIAHHGGFFRNRQEYSVANLPSGSYLVKVTTPEHVKISRLILLK